MTALQYSPMDVSDVDETADIDVAKNVKFGKPMITQSGLSDHRPAT